MESTKNRLELPFQKSNGHSRLFQELILKSWWMLLLLLSALFAYDRAMHHKQQEEKRWQEKWQMLHNEKIVALAEQEALKLQIASQEDPAFIELTLMRRLGLVPEGAKKIHFIPAP